MKLRLPEAKSIRTHMILWIVGTMAFVMIVMGALLRYSVESALIRSVDRELDARSVVLERMSERMDDLPAPDMPQPPPGWFRLGQPGPPPGDDHHDGDNLTRLRPRLFDLQGHSMFGQDTEGPWDAKAFAGSLRGQRIYKTITRSGQPVRIVSTPIHGGRNIVGVAQIAYPLSEVRGDMAWLTSMLLTLIPVALIFATISAFYLTERLLIPLRQITQTASQIGGTNLSQRLKIVGRDEFAQLSSTFNTMLERIERSFEQLRRFTADASHELRTPLTVIKAHTSFALHDDITPSDFKRTMQSCDQAATAMSRIVEDLLMLVRSDAGQLKMDTRPVAVREVIEAATRMLRVSQHAQIELKIDDPSPMTMGDPDHLIRLFTNLIDNAARHTPLNGRITISAECDRHMVRACVSDTGPGVAPEHLPHLCERFYRVDESRNRKYGGTGLGLAISKSIVEAHSGSMTFQSVEGSGLTVHIALPIA
ncbi:MAG: ATP-binding protein [Armatimonadota bacterium]|nr:HAMP domain-containing protein [bacterium]